MDASSIRPVPARPSSDAARARRERPHQPRHGSGRAGPRLDVAGGGVSGACDNAPRARGRSASPGPRLPRQARAPSRRDRSRRCLAFLSVRRGGRPRPSPVKNRPTFTLFVETDAGEIPLVRWPTTIGAWKAEKLDDDGEALRYKASPVGRWYWRDLVAAPAWFPPPTTPDRELMRRGPDGRWVPDEAGVGPGYRSAYGLVALFHHRAIATSGGGIEYADIEIRTHGSANYRSILRGSSHGCHRLFNHLAIRLGNFVLASTEHTRHGLIDQRYGRVLHWKGRTFRLRAESRGYRYELVSPIPVDVLPGRRVRSKAIPVAPAVLARRPRHNRKHSRPRRRRPDGRAREGRHRPARPQVVRELRRSGAASARSQVV